MLDVVIGTINELNMLARGDRVLIALSGGADSVALTYCLLKLKQMMSLSLMAIHINHGLRGHESINDETLVRLLCKNNEMELIVKHINILDIAKKDKMTLEEVGRYERYKCFAQAVNEHSLDKVALGHNKDDNAETILLNMMRGSGLKGLVGIPKIRDYVIRPLINVPKDDIYDFCKDKGLPFCIDSTNSDVRYMRNKIRTSLLPQLREQFNPHIVDRLCDMSDVIRAEDDFVEDIALDVFNNIVKRDGNILSISLFELKLKHIALQRRVIRLALKVFSPFLKGLSFRHITLTLGLVLMNSGKIITLPGDLIVEKTRKYLFMYNKVELVSDFYYELYYNNHLWIKELKVHLIISEVREGNNSSYYRISRELLKEPLIVRNAKPADKIHLKSMNGSKKLKNYFSEQSMPKVLQNKVIIIQNNNETMLIWGPQVVCSDKYRYNNKTKDKPLYIEVRGC